MKRVRGSFLLFALALVVSFTVPAFMYADSETPVVTPPPFAPAEGDTLESGVPAILGGSTNPYPIVSHEAAASPAVATDAPAIDVWYGDTQAFGERGNPQKWVNILGRVTSASPISSFTYTLNGGPSIGLSRGPNSERLYDAGDFNVELAIAELQPGANTVVIKAVAGGQEATKTVTVNYTPGQIWPLPYNINWASAGSINDVAQVVDGKWEISGNELHTVDPGFDRLVAVGDIGWSEYEVTVPVTIYDLNDGEWDDGHSNGGGVGFIVKWQGHYQLGTEQPNAGWRRLGALAWYRWSPQGKNTFEMRGNGGGQNSILVSRDDQHLEVGKTYTFKMNVQAPNIDGLPSKYRFKFWEQGQPEPAIWFMQSTGVVGEPRTGSILLVAHQVNVGFGNVKITPLDKAGTFTINVNDPANGQIFVDPQKPEYAYGESVTVRAMGDFNFKLDSWGGDLTGTNGNPVTFDVTQNLDLSANFVAAESNPKLTINTSGNGTVEVSPNKPQYRYGELVTLTPKPSNQYMFAGWGGGLTGADNPAQVVMTGDKTISATFVAANPASPVSDDFDECVLNTARWTFVNPLGDGTVTTDGEKLYLKASAGKSHNIWLEGNRSVRVMQNTANANFEIVTKFDSDVTKRYQMQGILVEQDAQNFLRFEVYNDGETNRIFAAKFVNGNPTAVIQDKTVNATPDYLRVTRVGSQWSYSYSLNGTTWIAAGSFVQAMTVSKSGVYSANHAPIATQSPEHITVVDYFFNTASPINNEDNDANKITVQKTGEGTVTLNPNKATYACGESVTLTAAPANGWSFFAWGGDLSGNQLQKTVIINSDVNVTATFVQGEAVRKLYLPSVISQ